MMGVFSILTALSTTIVSSGWAIKTGLFLLALLAAFASYFPNKFFRLKDWIIKKVLEKFDRKYDIQL